MKALLKSALTDKINDREVFMKGVDLFLLLRAGRQHFRGINSNGITNERESREGYHTGKTEQYYRVVSICF